LLVTVGGIVPTRTDLLEMTSDTLLRSFISIMNITQEES
jgi:hypothetical protein